MDTTPPLWRNTPHPSGFSMHDSLAKTTPPTMHFVVRCAPIIYLDRRASGFSNADARLAKRKSFGSRPGMGGSTGPLGRLLSRSAWKAVRTIWPNRGSDDRPLRPLGMACFATFCHAHCRLQSVRREASNASCSGVRADPLVVGRPQSGFNVKRRLFGDIWSYVATPGYIWPHVGFRGYISPKLR